MSEARRLCLRVFRHDPTDPASRPHLQSYEVQEAAGMTLFLALTEIRERVDPTLCFDFVCRAGICGSCGVIVNGRPRLACRTLTEDLPQEITLLPMPAFALIADLSVDTGKWMRALSERLEAWLHTKEPQCDLSRIEPPMEPDLADRIYELDRCIECGCCVAACGTAQMRADFAGAVDNIGMTQLTPM